VVSVLVVVVVPVLPVLEDAFFEELQLTTKIMVLTMSIQIRAMVLKVVFIIYVLVCHSNEKVRHYLTIHEIMLILRLIQMNSLAPKKNIGHTK
jgi:hypothetical protein